MTKINNFSAIAVASLLLAASVVAMGKPAKAQPFPVTLSFEHGDWKPPQAALQSAWSIYSAVPDSTTLGVSTYNVVRPDPNKFSYRIDGIVLDNDWLHFVTIQFDNPGAEKVNTITLPLRISPEIVNAVEWGIKFAEPPSLSVDDKEYEERVRRLRIGWDDKAQKKTLIPELSRFLEARAAWRQIFEKEDGYEFVKYLAIRHGLESAANIQRFSRFGLYFDETFIEEAIKYLDKLPPRDSYRPTISGRIGEVIFASWTQIGNAVPSRASTPAEKTRLCSMNLAYKKLAEDWSKNGNDYRKRYWSFRPSSANISVEDIGTRLDACDRVIAQQTEQPSSPQR